MSLAIRVLLVEDCEDDAVLLVRRLRDDALTLDFERVETTEALARALREKAWDVLLVDWKLPGFDGWEALRLLKESEKDIPFIIVSGQIGEETAVAAMKAGAQDFVTKDRLARLTPVIERELREVESRRARRDSEARLALSHAELERANSALREADRHKDEFLAVISHELRTPLNFITAFASLMEDDQTETLQTNQQLFLGKIQKGADRMLHLVNNLLDMSRIQAGRLSIDRENQDFETIIKDVVQSLIPMADEKGVTLVTRLNVPVIAYVDGGRIFQVFANLITNAITFTPVGGQILVEAYVEGGAIKASVSDTGPGISEQDLCRLFRRFSQLDMSYTRKAEGIGLGLSICQALVAAHGGDIGVTSRLGEGSRFWLQLPVQLPARVTAQP